MTKETNKESRPAHKWRFRPVGGFEQVVLETGEDLLRLDELDQKLWVALSCPTKGLEFDEVTLQMIDSDGDGRIRPPELIAAIKWACQRLTTPDTLLSGIPALPLASISESAPGGKALVSAAKRILKSVGKAGVDSISVEEAHQAVNLFAKLPFNGDGIIPPASAEEPAVKKVIEEIIATVGGEPDRNGDIGVTRPKVEMFYQEIEAYVAWWNAGEAEADNAELFPFGQETPAIYQVFRKVKEKLDDYFFRCRLGEYDERAISYLNCPEKDYLELSAKNLAYMPEELAARPLATIGVDRPLPLSDSLNPAWEAAVIEFRDKVVLPLLGKVEELRESDWLALKEKFARYESWLNSKKGSSVEQLGLARIRELQQGNEKEAVLALIERDLERSSEASVLQDLDRLAHYHRDLYKLARNFVSFHSFFSRNEYAIFQAGTLYLDSRSCELCIEINDPGAHSTLAILSRCYIAYCECRRAGSASMKIAAIFSNGDSDNLMVGRNGVFYDRRGRDWDATIVQIIDNPISIRQAFWAPYKKFARFVDEQLAKRAAMADEAATQKMASLAETTAQLDRAAPKAPEPKRIDVGTVAALGVALGSIGTFLTMILVKMIEFGPWLPVALLGVMLVISSPSMFMAWLKLRQRTLGPLLDASGWAINGKVKIGVRLAHSLTRLRKLPPGAVRELPVGAEGRARRRRIFWLSVVLGITLVVFGYFGYVNGWFTPSESVTEEVIVEVETPAP